MSGLNEGDLAMKEIELRVLDMSTIPQPSDSYAWSWRKKRRGHRKLALIIGPWRRRLSRIVQMPYGIPRPLRVI